MSYDVVIVGGGAMGCAAARFLAGRNQKVLVLEQEQIGHQRAASEDHSKVFRFEYASQLLYTQMAAAAYPLWRELEAESGEDLFHECGLLMFDPNDSSYAHQSFETMSKEGYAIEVWEEESIQARFPQFRCKRATFSPTGGLLDAGKVTRALAASAMRNGATIRESAKVVSIEQQHLTLSTGETVLFDRVIVCAGAWAGKLMGWPITPTRQQLLYFKPKSPHLFTKSNFPVFADLDSGWYGFPVHGDGTIKLSVHNPGPAWDPDTGHRETDAAFETEARKFFAQHLPDLADAEVVRTGVCLYSMTANEDFVIDRHDSMIIGAGFSGHGFKFVPLIGRWLGQLALDEPTGWDLGRFSSQQQPNW